MKEYKTHIGSLMIPEGFKYRSAYQKGRPKHEKYSDFWYRHMPMDHVHRAKIFSPFDALDGFDEAIRSAKKNSAEYSPIIYEPDFESNSDSGSVLNPYLVINSDPDPAINSCLAAYPDSDPVITAEKTSAEYSPIIYESSFETNLGSDLLTNTDSVIDPNSGSVINPDPVTNSDSGSLLNSKPVLNFDPGSLLNSGSVTNPYLVINSDSDPAINPDSMSSQSGVFEMCTRYYVELSPELRPYIETADRSPLKNKMIEKLGKPFKKQGEIRPTDMVAVIAPNKMGKKSVFPMIWGYNIPGISRPVVNSRVESAKGKKSFAESWEKRRCIVPASWYYEWEHVQMPDGRIKAGSKYAIQPRNSSVTWLAGLYRIEEDRGFSYPVFTILTRNPGESIKKIHDRMPVILPESVINEWITPGGDPDKVVQQALTDMVLEIAD